jgi:integrase
MQHGAVSAVWHGIRRAHGTAQTQKAPLLVPDLRRITSYLSDRSIGIRDRALLLVGFAGAFRRSELVALNCADIEFSADGMVVTLRRSKTDQECAGRKVGLPYGSNPETCPVRALRTWLETSGITEGALFRWIDRHGKMHDRLSGAAVALVVKRHVGNATQALISRSTRVTAYAQA